LVGSCGGGVGGGSSNNNVFGLDLVRFRFRFSKHTHIIRKERILNFCFKTLFETIGDFGFWVEFRLQFVFFDLFTFRLGSSYIKVKEKKIIN